MGRGDRIAVCADPSAELVAAILAIWTLGAAYVPLDPTLPPRRCQQIAEQAGISLLLANRAYVDGRCTAPEVLALEDVSPASGRRFWSDARGDDVSYIVFTSGSTGTPKGIELRHAGLTNAIVSSCEVAGFEAIDRALYRTSIAFDVSLYDMFCPLTVGATIVIAPSEARRDPLALIELIIDNEITALVVTPSLLALLLNERSFAECSTLRLVTCGGEALSLGLCRRFFDRSRASLYNLYGPSEATILVTLHHCTPRDLDLVESTAPLGIQLPNVHVSVRDADLQPVRPGEKGEIVIGGVQLAAGYLNLPGETALRFVHDPLRPGQDVYRSGDVARLLDDGNFVFLGRNDRQIKVRGTRVEPSEVAAAIERLEGVRSAVVIGQRREARRSDVDSDVLVAYVALLDSASLTSQQLLRELRAELPSAMIPSEVVFVEAFPHTVTGKVDERALAAGDYRPSRAVKATKGAYSPLRGITYEQLRIIWEEVLGLNDIGYDDDFVDLGGDSILAVRLMLKVEETFGRRVRLADFFQSMTIADFAELLIVGDDAEEDAAWAFNETGARPPLIYLHGDFAGGMYVRALARMLGSDQPLIVVPPHGIPGRPPVAAVSSMAADVVATIERCCPTGPLRIGGYSAAGLVAYEAARQCQDRGREIRDVVLIGTTAENVSVAGVAAAVQRLPLPASWRDVVVRNTRRTVFRLSRFSRLKLRERFDRTRRFVFLPNAPAPATTSRNIIEMSAGYERYVRAHELYFPGPYDGRVTVLWPRDELVENGDLRRDWLRIAPRAAFEDIPGGHHSAVSRYLSDLTAKMQRSFSD